MKVKTTTWTDNGRVKYEVEGFGTTTIVEPVTDTDAYLEVWDEAGLVRRSEMPFEQAVDEARLALFRAYRAAPVAVVDETPVTV